MKAGWHLDAFSQSVNVGGERLPTSESNLRLCCPSCSVFLAAALWQTQTSFLPSTAQLPCPWSGIPLPPQRCCSASSLSLCFLDCHVTPLISTSYSVSLFMILRYPHYDAKKITMDRERTSNPLSFWFMYDDTHYFTPDLGLRKHCLAVKALILISIDIHVMPSVVWIGMIVNKKESSCLTVSTKD